MGNDEITLDELLATQRSATGTATATIQEIPGDDTVVKVTPFIPNSGCACDYALDIPKSSIASVIKTDSVHYCCGNTLTVVNAIFNDEAYTNAFTQMAAKADAAINQPGLQTSIREGPTLRRWSGAVPGGRFRGRTGDGTPEGDCVNRCESYLYAADLAQQQGDDYSACQYMNGYRQCVASCTGGFARPVVCIPQTIPPPFI
jgi:hypothetical protein